MSLILLVISKYDFNKTPIKGTKFTLFIRKTHLLESVFSYTNMIFPQNRSRLVFPVDVLIRQNGQNNTFQNSGKKLQLNRVTINYYNYNTKLRKEYSTI